MRREPWDIISNNSVADHNVLPGIRYLKCKRKPDWTSRKFKARYCVRGVFQKRLSPEPLKLYFPVVQWATVRLMLIFQYIIHFRVKVLTSKITFLTKIFQVGRQSLFNSSGISITMEDNIMFL